MLFVQDCFYELYTYSYLRHVLCTYYVRLHVYGFCSWNKLIHIRILLSKTDVDLNVLQAVNIARAPGCPNRRATALRAGSADEARTQTNLRPFSMAPTDTASMPASAPSIPSTTPVAYVHQVGDGVLPLFFILCLLPHRFQLLCAVDVFYEMSSFSPVLRFLPCQFSLLQVVPDVIHLRFGLPLLLFPGTSIAINLLPTYSSSLLSTCPYHFNLLSCTFMDISPTFVVPLILSFLILSSLLTPLIHRNILISATSNFFSCAFFTVHFSAPYIFLMCLHCGMCTLFPGQIWFSRYVHFPTVHVVISSHYVAIYK